MPPLHYFFIILWRPQGLFLRIRIVIFVCQSIRAGDHIVSVKNTENVVSFFRFLFQTVCRRCHIHTKSFPALPYRSPTKEHRDRYTNRGMPYLHCHCSIFLQLCQDSVRFLCSPEIFADISRRAIKPRLYNIKEKKTVIRHSFRRQPFRLSCKLCTALSRYARLPNEKIQRNCRQREYGKNSDAENGFRLPAASNFSTACHDGVGLGECKKREKGEICF